VDADCFGWKMYSMFNQIERKARPTDRKGPRLRTRQWFRQAEQTAQKGPPCLRRPGVVRLCETLDKRSRSAARMRSSESRLLI
jgi:hypothetical protein